MTNRTISFIAKNMHGVGGALRLVGVITILLVIPKIGYPVISQVLVDNVLPGLNPEWETPLIAFAAAIILIEIVLRCTDTIKWRNRLTMSVSSASRMFWHAIRLPVSFFHDKYVGDIVPRISYGKEISLKIVSDLSTVLADIVLIVFYLFFMIKYNLVLSIFAILHIVLNFVVLRVIREKRVSRNRAMQSEIGKLQGFTTASINNIDAIKGATAEQDYFQKWSENFSRMQQATIRNTTNSIWTETLPLMMEAVSNVFVLGIGVYVVTEKCTRFSLKSVPLERRIKGNKSLLFLS